MGQANTLDLQASELGLGGLEVKPVVFQSSVGPELGLGCPLIAAQ